MRLVLLLSAVTITAVAVSSAVAAPTSTTKPAIETKSNLGKVIATPRRIAIYYWDVEKKAGGKIRCTSSACLKEWPIVYVAGTVPKHVAGVMATFGTIKRGTKRQLTINGLPAYTYVGDTAGIVKCDNFGGWHVVRP